MAVNPRVFGKYEVIRRLAVGGMGEIFLARQVGMAGFERLVILKSLLPQLASDEDMLSQFLDEGRIVGSINHPNVVACYEVGEWEGVYFIAMEYINGVDLATLSKACDDVALRFPIHVAMTIVREAALGLDSAHHANDAQSRPLKIVHRDISPHNVMVRQDGLAKIVDFGVAVAANRQKRTEGGLLKGKLGYMAPEQIKGLPLDGRSDQFSLGVLFWELLTARRLFQAEDPHAVFMKIVRETVPAPSSVMPDVPPEVDAIVLRMTAQEPADRYQRLSECAAVLRKLLDARGANENETPDLVGGLVGAQLAERVRDLSPSPVRILGVGTLAVNSEPTMSASFCQSCGEQAVHGDRFCRSCGAPLSAARKSTPPPMTGPGTGSSRVPGPAAAAATIAPPPRTTQRDDDFAEIGDDMIDVSIDDVGPSETAMCVGVLELVDGVGTHLPPDGMLRPIFAHLEELAARGGGAVTTSGARIVVSFTGNGRAARSALAFARRVGTLISRHRDLRFRAAVAADAADDVDARTELLPKHAERTLSRARTGTVLVTEGARRLASVAHAWTGRVQVDGDDALVAWEVPLPVKLAGRGAERAIVEQAIASADVGRAQQHLLLGDAGQGKTALLDLVDGEARDRGFIVARARCGRHRGVVRYDAVRQAIRSACLELLVVGDLTAETSADWQRGLEILALTPHERARIVALVDDTAGSDQALPLARRRVLLRAAILGFWSSLAERRGACILVDDVHRGDASSLEVFAEVGARLHSARFAIFATSRPMQGARVLPLAKRAVLVPLEKGDTAQVASIALSASLPDAVGTKIATASSGSPLFAALLARHLRDIHLLLANGVEVIASADLEGYPAPPNLPVLLFGAHALLPKASRDVLVAASHLGASFSSAELMSLLSSTGGDGTDPLPALRACAASGALVDEGGGRFAFHTSSEREVLAARADPSIARRWHEAIGRELAGRSPVSPSQGVRPVELEERLVEHALAAEDREGAAAASGRAGDAWVALGALDAAVDHYRRALHAEWKALGAATADGSVDDERAQRVFDLARRATLAIGEIDPTAAVDLVMPLARALPPRLAVAARAAALRARASVLLKLRRVDDALDVLDEVLAMFGAEGASDASLGALLVDAGLAFEQNGNPDGAKVRLEDALKALAHVDGPERARAVDALLALGRIHLRGRELAKAREVLQLALDEARKRGAVSMEIDVLLVTSNLEQQEGHVERAAAALDEAILAAGRIGDGIAEARVRQTQARALHAGGKLQDAIGAARLSLAGATRLGWDEGMAVAHQLLQTWDSRS